MITQADDPHHFVRRARKIKTQIPALLSQWGLLPKFKRWRLAQDPDTGMVVLFGILNNKYIATHTTTPFSDYFDPRLLRDLATELNIQVISSANDGLRYAFILETGQLEIPDDMPALADAARGEAMSSPVPVETPECNAIDPSPLNNPTSVLNHTMLHQRLSKLLTIAEALGSKHTAVTQTRPEVLLMDGAEFNQQMAEYETNRDNNNPPMPGSVG